MSANGGYGKPGQGTGVATDERELYWGGDDRQLGILRKSIVLSSTATDAGNTPTSIFRKGMLLGIITATGEYAQWDSTATDGTQNIAGVLNTEMKVTDLNGTAVDRVPAGGATVRAPIMARYLLIKGVAFVGHADEYLARRQMAAAGFVFDDDPMGYLTGNQYRTVVKAADYSVLATDNGTTFTTRGAAAAVNFTLPAIAKGLEFSFYNEADQSLTLTPAAVDTLVTFNDLAADTVAFATASEQIGGRFDVRANDNASKWLVSIIAQETQTVTVAT